MQLASATATTSFASPEKSLDFGVETFEDEDLADAHRCQNLVAQHHQSFVLDVREDGRNPAENGAGAGRVHGAVPCELRLSEQQIGRVNNLAGDHQFPRKLYGRTSSVEKLDQLNLRVGEEMLKYAAMPSRHCLYLAQNFWIKGNRSWSHKPCACKVSMSNRGWQHGASTSTWSTNANCPRLTPPREKAAVWAGAVVVDGRRVLARVAAVGGHVSGA